MLGLSIWKIAIIGGVVMVLFGRGKVSELMGDVAKGIKSFKKGMAEDDTTETQASAGRVEQHERHGGGAIDVTPEARKDRA